MEERRGRKNLVLSKRELGEPSSDERARIRHVVDTVPSAQIAADYGPIVQVDLEVGDEPMLRSMIEQSPRWDVSDDAVGQLPVEKQQHVYEERMPVPTKLVFGLD